MKWFTLCSRYISANYSENIIQLVIVSILSGGTPADGKAHLWGLRNDRIFEWAVIWATPVCCVFHISTGLTVILIDVFGLKIRRAVPLMVILRDRRLHSTRIFVVDFYWKIRWMLADFNYFCLKWSWVTVHPNNHLSVFSKTCLKQILPIWRS